MSFNILDTISTIKYSIEKYSLQHRISMRTLVEHEIDALTDDLLLRFSRSIVTDKLKGSYFQYPRNTWEMFKKEFMPKWFLQRYPIKYTRQYYDFRVLYPDYILPNNVLGKGYIELIKQPIFLYKDL